MKKVFIFLAVLSIAGKTRAQINLATGSATFSLPMFNWQDDKSRLNSVVALNYNSGNGLKVGDVASNVGQGWSLIAGGQIIRMQSGEPDDQKPRDGASDDILKYPAGFLYDPMNANAGSPSSLTKYPIYAAKNRVYKQNNPVAADKELDRFAFQFNGKSGIFVLNKASSNTAGDVGMFLGDTRMKVWFTRDESMISQGIRTTINAFYIQDENGLIYKFRNCQTTTVSKVKYCDANLTASQTQPDMGGKNVYHEKNVYGELADPYIINGWYLSEIEDVLTHRIITFGYGTVNRTINTTAGNTIAYYGEKDYSLISHNWSSTKTPVISNITYPDGHIVNFNYANDYRADMKYDKALASVDILYESRTLSKYELTTSYFLRNRYGKPSNLNELELRSARLCLLSVKKIGVDQKSDDPPYNFDYYTGSSTPDDIVPPPFFHIKDIWGYYNGDNNKDFFGTPIPITTPLSNLSTIQLMGLCYLREGVSGAVLNAKAGYAKNGLLKEINYPTGGQLKYNYEQNTAILNNQTTLVGGVHVSQTLVTDGGYSNDCNNPIVTNYSYTTEGSNQSSLWGMEMPVNTTGSTSSHYEPEYKYYTWGIRHGCFPFGCCKYKYQYPGILSKENSIDLTGHQKFMETLSLVLDVVGAVMVVIDVITIALSATGYGAVLAIIIDIIAGLFNILYSCLVDYSRDVYSTVYRNADLNSVNPLPTQFKRVEVTEGSGSNGKTVHEFTSSDDYPIWAATNPTLSSKQRFAYWAYGLPKKTTIYDASGNKVKQTENVYDYGYAKTQCNGGISTDKTGNVLYYGDLSSKAMVKRYSSQRNTNWEDPGIYNASYQRTSSSDMDVDMYGYCSGRTELKTTFERTYKQSDPSQFVETKTDYTYHNYNYQVKTIQTTETSGDVKTKTITYTDDHSDAAALGALRAAGIVLPVTTHIAVVKNGSTQSGLLNETVTEFTSTASGDVKPYRTIERRFKEPFYYTYSYWVREFYVHPGYANNPIGYVESQLLTYDASGRIAGMKDEGDRTVTNIYDYNDKYVVASVINAVPITDKCAYTSFETQAMGGWTLTGAANYGTTVAVTGTRSFDLSGANSLTALLNTAKPYFLSFWANNGTVVVSGGSLLKSGPTINGFTYYEYGIAQGNASVTVSSSSSTIDELRLYPKTARMRTVSYDPLIGKTSECDENNRITYYEYDDKARLRFIKDDNGNIIKMYEYNISGKRKTGPCVTTYSNYAISETFQKNNCSAGYEGSMVTYTIPAGTYTSTISQAFVDMKAQYELDQLGQNYANTNGTCLLLYYNPVMSQNFKKQDCPIGYTGTTVTYTVPAGRYSSTISQPFVNQLAQTEIDANGQAYANAPGNGTCVIDTEPDWIGTGLEQCEMVNGQYTGHRLYQVRDQNPNSSSYNQVQWSDGGQSSLCPASCKTYKITVPNSCASIVNITYMPCSTGVNVTVPWTSLQTEDNGNGTRYIYMCLRQTPTYTYNTNQIVPPDCGITIEQLGSCN